MNSAKLDLSSRSNYAKLYPIETISPEDIRTVEKKNTERIDDVEKLIANCIKSESNLRV